MLFSGILIEFVSHCRMMELYRLRSPGSEQDRGNYIYSEDIILFL